MLESAWDLDQNAVDKAVTGAGRAEEVPGGVPMRPVGSNSHDSVFYKECGSRQPPGGTRKRDRAEAGVPREDRRHSLSGPRAPVHIHPSANL